MKRTYLSTNIRTLRKRSNILMADMANDLQIHISTISGWENGRGMDVYNLIRLTEYFNVSADALLFRDLRKDTK